MIPTVQEVQRGELNILFEILRNVVGMHSGSLYFQFLIVHVQVFHQYEFTVLLIFYAYEYCNTVTIVLKFSWFFDFVLIVILTFYRVITIPTIVLFGY